MNNTSRKNMLDDSMLVTLHKISHQIYIKHNELLLEHDITVQQSRVLIFIIMNNVLKIWNAMLAVSAVVTCILITILFLLIK